ncbi:hypothetical protein [Kribbella sp. NPDC051770]|uniref:hypothetical protein n=1 Tax=Kribbella sp. NPDC051770 TaxID=3155413 RepID=UPI0034242D37
MTVGGVDTYYDYDEQQWKHRKLGGGPVRRKPVCPLPISVPTDIPHEDDAEARRAIGQSADQQCPPITGTRTGARYGSEQRAD